MGSWMKTFDAWKGANPTLAKELDDAVNNKIPDLNKLMDEFPIADVATRVAGAEVLQPIAQSMPFYVSGSADLHGSNKNYMKNVGDFSKNNYAGRNFYYGIREHAMGAGEDGPTHQPVETVSSLRVMPNLDVMRPGDAEETAAAYVHSIARTTGPTALILSRQNLPVLEALSAQEKRAGTLKGAYTLVKETAELENIIIGVGSELSMAVEAAKELGAGTRVVSMPCVELFEEQSAEYKEEILPAAMKSKTTAVEAGVSAIWYKYADKVQGVDSFGLSAPADLVFAEKGMTVENLVALVKA